LLIWLAYFLLPNDAGGLVHGIPLSPVEAAALLMLAWLWLVRRSHGEGGKAGVQVPGAWVVAIVLAVTYVSGIAIPGQGGFRARYFANESGTGTHERSTEYPGDAFTRIDRKLDFDPNRVQVPLPFFNESNRFNFYKVGEPQRRYLGFAVRWSGWWWVDEERRRLYLDAPSAAAAIFIDGNEVMTLAPGEGSPIVREIELTRGWHRLDVTFSSPYASPRVFSSGVMDGDRRLPFDDRVVVTQQVREWQMTSAQALGRIKLAIDVGLLVCLGWLVATALAQVAREWRHRRDEVVRLQRVRRIFWAVAAAEAMVFALRWWGRNMLLVGGDDTLTYEGYARDILLNGILMNGGAPAGQGEPFYYQAGYPYFLAAAHALFGEGMFGPVLLQRLLAAWAIWTLVKITVVYTTARAWIVALPIASAFIAWKFWPIAAQPLNESLYVPTLVASAAALVHLCRQPDGRGALRAGLLSGVTTVTRSTALLAWAIVWPACWLALKGRRHRAGTLAVLAGSMLAVFSLITIRNWVVANVFAPSPTELGITLRGGNEIPPGVVIDLAHRAAIYRRFDISDHTATVIEFAIAAPGLFALNIGRKALFALGYYELYAPGWGLSPVYLAVWSSAVAGVIVLWRSRPSPDVLIPALVALTQFIAVVIVYPKGERLIVPIHTLLVPYAAIAAMRLIELIRNRSIRGSGTAAHG
jgi:hypothetical protein